MFGSIIKEARHASTTKPKNGYLEMDKLKYSRWSSIGNWNFRDHKSCPKALPIRVSKLLFQIPTGSGDIGGSLEWGNLKSWKTLRLEGSGWILVRKINRSLRYVIYIIGMDPLYWEGGVNSERILSLKNYVFLTYEGVIRSSWSFIFRRTS